MENTSYIEISRKALQNNLDYIRSKMKADTRLSLVVKGNAYGHGIDSYVPLAASLGVDHFSVFDAHEAYRLKAAVDSNPEIMIMGMIGEEQLAWAIEQGVSFFVFEEKRLKEAIGLAKILKTKAKIHLELETGMNRTGFESTKWNKVAQLILDNSEYLELEGLCTHFAGAESIANHLRVRQQIKKYKKGRQQLEKKGLKAKMAHTACSAAFLRFPQTHHDLVRIGILQYGYWPSVETFIATEGMKENAQDPLERVISWKSRVMNVKSVPKGQYVGYGTSFLATQDLKIATVPVGYSHGFSRSLSNAGRALVRGMRVGVIGVVNMNVMILDISHLDNVEVGDEVVLIGDQGEQSVSVSSFSEYSDQMNYELLTRLPLDIPRYIKD